MTAGTTRNYVWNAGNQLVTYYNQVGSADPTIFAQYDYSGMNRVSKLVKTGTSANPVYERTIYIDGIFEYHILENGTTYEKNYVHIMDDQSRIAMVRIGNPFPDDIADAVVYNLEDQIGSSTIRLNTDGGIIDKEEYYPFGDSSIRTFTKKRYRYVGKEKDLESGLYYYGARYYAAWTCRFISVDPLAHDYMHLTPYNYAGNKPINSIDIDGMQGENEQESGGNTNNNIENGDKPKTKNEFNTPGNGSVKFKENATVTTTTEPGTVVLKESRDEVPVDEGVLTEFKVNGIEYKSFFEKQNDGSWKFKGYRDKDKNVYDNFDEAESTTGGSATDENSAEGSINNDTTTEAPSSSDNSGASQDGNRDLENTIDSGGKGAGFINIFGSLIELNALAAKYETVQYAQIIPKANNPNRVISAKGLEKYYSKFFIKLAKIAGRVNVITGAISAGATWYKIYKTEGDIDPWDMSDAIIGTIGVIAGGIGLIIASPILIGIGVVAFAYFVGRLFIGPK